MKIRRVHLKNYRSFKRADFNLHPNLTIFVGDNGLGKTSIVHALRLLLWSYVRHYDEKSRQGTTPKLDFSDVHQSHIKNKQKASPLYPCTVEGEIFFPSDGDYYDFDSSELLDDDIVSFNIIGCTLESKNKKQKWIQGTLPDGDAILKTLDILTNHLDYKAEKEKDVELFVIAYYGTNRLWKKDVKFKNKENGTSRFAGYDGATSANSSFINLEFFLMHLFCSKDSSLLKQNDINELWLGVTNAIHSITGWELIFPQKGEKDFFFRQSGSPKLKLSQMGDGVRGMIQLVGDLACRCALLNPYYGKESAKKTSGIVLIDEIDLHLHPRWQQKILIQLQENFPKVQFIVTTHSPQVLTTAPAESIRILQAKSDITKDGLHIEIRSAERQTEGVASSVILAEIMDIDPVPDVKPARQLSKYMALILQNLENSFEGLELRKYLDIHFGNNHYLMLECQRLIRLQELKRKLINRNPNINID